jgi:DNA-binding response OmpR family regulator
MNEKIWVVEDDADTARLLKDGLSSEGYRVTTFPGAEEALQALRDAKPDLFLLDVQMGGISGLQLLELLRRDPVTADIPVVMLTSRAAEMDRVTGLKLGADDYVVKPHSEKELLARVEAHLRRARRTGVPEKTLAAPGLRVNIDSRQVLAGEELVNLSKLEFDLLAHLMQKHKAVQTYRAIAQAVWGEERTATTHTITVTMSRLKEKLGASGRYLQAVPGIGYRFSAE